MKNFSLKLLLVLFIAVGLSGCEKEETSLSSNCEFTDAEYNAYYNLVTKFSANPTVANCNALKQASFKLIDKFKNCDVSTKEQITQLTQAWNSIDCNDFD
ncbi:MAG TPA: hypothetical protein VFM79_12070 [Pelobium sp.]|nr:hypothetical protein [Pelobium sp.]